jgi:NAD-reducing hydrogenase large subunit
MHELLSDSDVLSPDVRAFTEPNCDEDLGISESPRGASLHHYKVDRNGLMLWPNLIIANGHNNLGTNRGVEQAATNSVRDGKFSEGRLNRTETVIRSFDRCLSCSTHAVGQMPLDMDLRSVSGALLDNWRRG